MTVSDDRREAVDFTVSFMNFGTDILMLKRRGAADNASATQSPPLPTISSISDLARQNVVKYGVVRDGRTADFFRTSQDPAYKQMWIEMSANPDYGTVPNTEGGVALVRQSGGRYVFIIEGTTAGYWVQRQPCDLVSVDGKMDRRQYALAVRRGDQFKAKLDEALTQMEEDGELDQLRHKWWIDKSECSAAASFIHAAGVTLLTALTAAAFHQL